MLLPTTVTLAVLLTVKTIPTTVTLAESLTRVLFSLQLTVTLLVKLPNLAPLVRATTHKTVPELLPKTGIVQVTTLPLTSHIMSF